MHWDVVEVKAESGHRLFVRFTDGTSGKVQLHLSELSGDWHPSAILRFERAFVDRGAVAWPGDIELAPDAIYEQVVKQGT